MAFQKIDARTILVTSTPQIETFADKPEPVRTEDRKLDRKELKKRKFQATDEEFAEIIEGSGFPPAGKRTAFGGRVTLIWSESVVDRWISERVAAAEKTLRLMGR